MKIQKSLSVRGVHLNFSPACTLLAALAFVLLMILRTAEVLKKSLKSERGDHGAVVSNIGPGVLAGMNLTGFGLVSLSSLLCHLSSSSSSLTEAVEADPPRPCFAFLLGCVTLTGESESDSGDGGGGRGAEARRLFTWEVRVGVVGCC